MLMRDTGIEPVTACQTARTLSPNPLSPNLSGDVDTGRLDGGVSVTAKLARTPGNALDAGDAELRRLIREGFEEGIPASTSPRRPGCLCRASIRSGTGDGRTVRFVDSGA